MKKILLILLVLFLAGCRKQEVIETRPVEMSMIVQIKRLCVRCADGPVFVFSTVKTGVYEPTGHEQSVPTGCAYSLSKTISLKGEFRIYKDMSSNIGIDPKTITDAIYEYCYK